MWQQEGNARRQREKVTRNGNVNVHGGDGCVVGVIVDQALAIPPAAPLKVLEELPVGVLPQRGLNTLHQGLLL